MLQRIKRSRLYELQDAVVQLGCVWGNEIIELLDREIETTYQEESVSLCPKCHKQGLNVEMKVVGDELICPECLFRQDKPQRLPTYEELQKELKVTKIALAHANELIDYLQGGNID
jgi:hypothetical protein